MKKLVSILLLLISVFCISFALVGCKNSQSDDLVWANDNAVYAYVKTDFENEIFKNVEGAFDNVNFQKVYITNKTPKNLTLLFILEENDVADTREFIDVLSRDERISGVIPCRDLPFESVDTRYIEKEKDTLSVGEEMVLTLVAGKHEYYIQQFDFGGLFVKPKEVKNYSVRDFKGINIKSVNERENGWLYLELAKENYFDVIKALDNLSRIATFEEVKADTSKVWHLPPPYWEVSDTNVAEIKANEDYYTATIKGLKPGEVSVGFDGVRCNIVIK